MADNTTLNVGASGDVIRDIDRSGVKTQVVQLDAGGSSAESLVSAANPMPAYPPPFTQTGTFTATGQTVQFAAGLKGACTVGVSLTPNAMVAFSLFAEVLIDSLGGSRWEPARGVYLSGTAGSLPPPSIAFPTGSSLTINGTAMRAVFDVAGALDFRIRSTSTFTGTSEAVAMTASYTPTSRIAPDGFPATVPVSLAATSGVNIVQINATAPATISAVGSNTIQSGFALSAAAAGGAPVTAEVASAARTTTGNSGTIADAFTGAVTGTINVTVSSGTTPTLDVVLQESPNNGTTWVDVYHCERIVTTGVYLLPSVPLNGRRRWAWTITGTTPSFTFSVTSTRGGMHPYPRAVQFFDRTAGLLAGTAATNGVSFNIFGCKTVTSFITIGAATTPASYKIQGSMDGVNWYDMSTVVAAVANSTVQVTSNTGVVARFGRVVVSAAATAQTGTVVGLSACN